MSEEFGLKIYSTKVVYIKNVLKKDALNNLTANFSRRMAET